jgi:hypothetical protein
MTSELVTARHLGRKAVIYIRQSTPQQVLSNQESLRLQYAFSNSNWPDRRTGIIVRVEPRHGAAVLNRSESA